MRLLNRHGLEGRGLLFFLYSTGIVDCGAPCRKPVRTGHANCSLRKFRVYLLAGHIRMIISRQLAKGASEFIPCGITSCQHDRYLSPGFPVRLVRLFYNSPDDDCPRCDRGAVVPNPFLQPALPRRWQLQGIFWYGILLGYRKRATGQMM
jgi:hypothetical protein